ncbi:MAG: ABC transporter permease [Actinomycetota bacterium]|nr:ABC transporter permease [Actinomycetota bacterium]
MIRRLLWSVVMVVLVISVVFGIFFVLPGGAGKKGAGGYSFVAVSMAGRRPSAANLQDITEKFGLDQPIYVQFGRYLGNAIKGDLGNSYQTNEKVTDAVLRRLPATVSLALGASVIWLVLGVSIGVISALKRRTIWDRGSMFIALVGVSMPTFWLGLVAVFFFDSRLNIYDTGTYARITEDPVGWFKAMWLPWLVLAFVSMAIYSRMVRGNVLEVQGEDYIRTARAKGLKERSVIRHQLRSALTPVVTMYGLDLGILLGGAVITEHIFNLPGIGAFAVQSIQNNNLPIILGVTVIAAVFVIVANLLVDIAYAFLDPRVKYS